MRKPLLGEPFRPPSRYSERIKRVGWHIGSAHKHRAARENEHFTKIKGLEAFRGDRKREICFGAPAKCRLAEDSIRS